MPPIPAKKPKSVKPFTLESTLGDLSSIRAQGIDLSVLLDQSADGLSSDAQSDEAVKKSQEFIRSVRNALEVDGDVAAQGDRVEVARNPNQSLRAITIRQIYTAEQTHSDAEFMIDGSETTQVTLVAQVVAANKQATNITYKLNDGTAEIKAKHWLDSSEEEAIGHGQSEHVYIRVVGTLKTFSGERQINAVHTRLVTDPMEIYYHLIEAQLVHLHYTRVQHVADRSMESGAVPSTISAGAPAASAYQAGGKGQQSKFANFPPLQRRILEVLDQLMPQHDEGVHVTTIASGLNVQASIDEIGATMEKLAEEGHIYATKDDEHFAIS
ncbi:replication factor A protein 2 [Ceratobasidium sp. 423]|nr:replication factor A protein 2 [Ceratobasidium sp. 423]